LGLLISHIKGNKKSAEENVKFEVKKKLISIPKFAQLLNKNFLG
jgi:hypothetical protein